MTHAVMSVLSIDMVVNQIDYSDEIKTDLKWQIISFVYTGTLKLNQNHY